jgi:hypothetical protein
MKIVEVQAIKGVNQVVEEVKITQIPVIKAATEVQERVGEAANFAKRDLARRRHYFVNTRTMFKNKVQEWDRL